MGTAKAVSGPAAALIQKGQGSRTLDGLFYRHLVDIAQIPLVQHKEVAGIEAAVPLHDQVASAGARGGTGAGGHPGQDAEIVVKETDAHIVASLQIQIPAVKQVSKKLTVPLGGQRPGHTPTFPL